MLAGAPLLTANRIGKDRFTRKERMQSRSSFLQAVKSIIPPLSSNVRKGDAGRIGVIGGSLE